MDSLTVRPLFITAYAITLLMASLGHAQDQELSDAAEPLHAINNNQNTDAALEKILHDPEALTKLIHLAKEHGFFDVAEERSPTPAPSPTPLVPPAPQVDILEHLLPHLGELKGLLQEIRSVRQEAFSASQPNTPPSSEEGDLSNPPGEQLHLAVKALFQMLHQHSKGPEGSESFDYSLLMGEFAGKPPRIPENAPGWYSDLATLSYQAACVLNVAMMNIYFVYRQVVAPFYDVFKNRHTCAVCKKAN